MKYLISVLTITVLATLCQFQASTANDLPQSNICIQSYSANIRSGPGQSHTVLTQIKGIKAHKGTPSLRVKQRTNNWLQVELPNDKGEGWISESLTKPATYVTTPSAPINIFPAETPVGNWPQGTSFCTDGHKGTWHKVRLEEKTIFIDSRLTSRFANSDYGGDFITAILDCDKEKVQEMIKNGLDPVKYPNGTGYWRGVEHSPLYWALWGGCFEVAETLVQAGVNPNFGGMGSNLLYHAVLNVKTNQVKWLLAHGVDVNSIENISRSTPLMAAAGYATPEIVKLLLKNGAQINTQDEFGITPLMHAANWKYDDWGQASQNQTEVVEILLRNGADITIKDSRGLTALDRAIKRNHKEIETILRVSMIANPIRNNSIVN